MPPGGALSLFPPVCSHTAGTGTLDASYINTKDRDDSELVCPGLFHCAAAVRHLFALKESAMIVFECFECFD